MSLSLKGVLGGIGKAVGAVAKTVSSIPVAGAILKSPIAKVVPGLNVLSTAVNVATLAGGAAALLTKRAPTAPPAAPLPPNLPTPPMLPVSLPQSITPFGGQSIPVPAASMPPMMPTSAMGLAPLPMAVAQQAASPALAGVGRLPQVISRAAPVVAAGAAAIGRRLSWAAQGIKRVPGSKIITTVGGYYVLDKLLGWVFQEGAPPKRRQMNVLNPRALKRADRRVCGFAHYAKAALRQYGYQVSSRKPSAMSKGRKKTRCR